jgi:hypothetical protein
MEYFLASADSLAVLLFEKRMLAINYENLREEISRKNFDIEK